MLLALVRNAVGILRFRGAPRPPQKNRWASVSPAANAFLLGLRCHGVFNLPSGSSLGWLVGKTSHPADYDWRAQHGQRVRLTSLWLASPLAKFSLFLYVVVAEPGDRLSAWLFTRTDPAAVSRALLRRWARPNDASHPAEGQRTQASHDFITPSKSLVWKASGELTDLLNAHAFVQHWAHLEYFCGQMDSARLRCLWVAVLSVVARAFSETLLSLTSWPFSVLQVANSNMVWCRAWTSGAVSMCLVL